LKEMGLTGYYKEEGDMKLVDDGWNPQWQDLDLKDDKNSSALVRILRSNCHWYSTPIGGGCYYWKQQ